MADLAFPHGGNIYAFKRRDIIDFSANINPLGLPKRIKETIYKSFDKALHYPDPKAEKLTRRIAGHWGIKEKNILLGNGSAELIYLAMTD